MGGVGLGLQKMGNDGDGFAADEQGCGCGYQCSFETREKGGAFWTSVLTLFVLRLNGRCNARSASHEKQRRHSDCQPRRSGTRRLLPLRVGFLDRCESRFGELEWYEELNSFCRQGTTEESG